MTQHDWLDTLAFGLLLVLATGIVATGVVLVHVARPATPEYLCLSAPEWVKGAGTVVGWRERRTVRSAVPCVAAEAH